MGGSLKLYQIVSLPNVAYLHAGGSGLDLMNFQMSAIEISASFLVHWTITF